MMNDSEFVSVEDVRLDRCGGCSSNVASGPIDERLLSYNNLSRFKKLGDIRDVDVRC